MREAASERRRRPAWTEEQMRSLDEYVERELDAWLPSATIPWRGGDAYVESDPSASGRWTWELVAPSVWEIRGGGTISIEPYYQLIASFDAQHFVITHSNMRAGIWGPHWLEARATVVPFLLVEMPPQIPSDKPAFRIARRPLSRVLDALFQAYKPNYEWPT